MGKTNPEELTPQQRLFCHEYLIDLNATQAAVRAGYAERSAGNQGHVLFNTPKIQEEIQRLMDKRAEKIDISAETILRELLKIATIDIRKAFDESGNLLPVHQLPEEIAKSISGIETYVENVIGPENNDDSDEDQPKVIGTTKKVKFWDKTKSLELLGRHLKLFTEKVEVEHSGALEKLSDADLDAKIAAKMKALNT